MAIPITTENPRFRGEIICDSPEERDQFLQLIFGYGHAASAIPLGGGRWKVTSFEAEE
uniref:Uncharacterized protein n=1 Tax=uncultured bacterium Contig643 TaxID=1393602 RepID=W0FMM6_9BACT|nr:hypothetical protein [uncultured bacterium Contig643]